MKERPRLEAAVGITVWLIILACVVGVVTGAALLVIDFLRRQNEQD